MRTSSRRRWPSYEAGSAARPCSGSAKRTMTAPGCIASVMARRAARCAWRSESRRTVRVCAMRRAGTPAATSSPYTDPRHVTHTSTSRSRKRARWKAVMSATGRISPASPVSRGSTCTGGDRPRSSYASATTDGSMVSRLIRGSSPLCSRVSWSSARYRSAPEWGTYCSVAAMGVATAACANGTRPVNRITWHSSASSSASPAASSTESYERASTSWPMPSSCATRIARLVESAGPMTPITRCSLRRCGSLHGAQDNGHPAGGGPKYLGFGDRFVELRSYSC